MTSTSNRTMASLTSANNYFENFEAGQTFRHARGKTMTNLENVNITNMVLNTADTHFNEDRLKKFGDKGAFKAPSVVAYGGVTFSIVLGLSAQDCVENAIVELGLNGIRLKTPVFHDDTIYAYTKVLEVRDSDREDAGIVVFKHWGVNDKERVVCELERTALIKRASHWADK